MKAVFKILFISLLLISNTLQKCGFDHEKQKNTKIERVNLWGEDHGRFLQSTSWTPIRIYLDYTTLDAQKGQISDDLIANIKKVMTTVASSLSNLINVKASSSALKITSCSDEIKIGSTVQSGVQADLVIFPFVDLKAAETTEASATYCGQDNTTGRPVAGYVGFNKLMDFAQKNAMYYQSLLVFHEVNHILSFNASLFEEFVDSSNNRIPLSSVVTTSTVNGVSRNLLSTPKVVAAAKKHFGCNSLTGVELENQGGAGTAGSHWEFRVMAGDYMIGESYGENVISDITLALMEDSGWYTVNYYTGGLFRFGKNQGCDFLNTKCIVNGATKFQNDFSAKATKTPMCGAGRTFKGTTSLGTANETIDSAYRYFSDATQGGLRLADYCPVAQEYGSDGYWFAGSCWFGKSSVPSSMGETIGANSYCFISSLTPTNDNSSSGYKGKDISICHSVVCNSSDRTYTVTKGTTAIKCPTAGGPVSASGFDGILQCPDYNLICTKNGACGDTIDCIAKKITSLSATYDYTSKTTQDASAAGSVTTVVTVPTSTLASVTVTTSTTTASTTTTDPTTSDGLFSKVTIFAILAMIVIFF
jgi:hypothetical protein